MLLWPEQEVLSLDTYCIAIPVYTSSTVPVDMDTIAAYDKPGMVILESNWIGVIAPIIEVIGELREVSINIPHEISEVAIHTVHTPFHSTVTSEMTGFSFVPIQ